MERNLCIWLSTWLDNISSSFVFHCITHPYLNWVWLVTRPCGVCKSGQNTTIKLLSFPSDTHVLTHTHTYTQHTNWDFLCFAVSRKKHPDVSSSPTTLPEYRGALWCCKATPNLFSQETQSETASHETHTHTRISPNPVALHHTVYALHVQLSRHGSLGQTIFLHLLGMKCHEEGEARGKVSQWDHLLLSQNVLVCFLLLLLFPLLSSSCDKENMTVTDSVTGTRIPLHLVSACPIFLYCWGQRVQSIWRKLTEALTAEPPVPLVLAKVFPHTSLTYLETFFVEWGELKNWVVYPSCPQL